MNSIIVYIHIGDCLEKKIPIFFCCLTQDIIEYILNMKPLLTNI